MAFTFSNNAQAVTTADLTTGSTFLTMANADLALFVGNGQRITLIDASNNLEVVEFPNAMNDVGADRTSITRALEGTTALAFTAGSKFEGRLTAAALDSFLQGSADNFLVVDNGGNATGVNSLTIQSGRTLVDEVASGIESLAIGADSKASAQGCTALGYQSKATSTVSTALGWKAEAAISGTHNISFPSLVRKDNGEAAFNEESFYSGQETYTFSKILDLTAAPTSELFSIGYSTSLSAKYISEVGIVIVSSNTVTVQPQISFGINGNDVGLIAQVATVKSAAGSMEKYTSLLAEDAEDVISFSLKVAATATTLTARVYFKYLLLGT